MDLLSAIWTAWNEQLGTTITAIIAIIALLKSTGKEIHQLGATVWRWKTWTLISKIYGKAKTLYRLRRAKSVMRRTLEGQGLRIGIRVYENCLRDNPSKSAPAQLEDITPVKPSWLNDYYVATALESLSNERQVVKAKRYSVKSWPPNAEIYDFVA